MTQQLGLFAEPEAQRPEIPAIEGLVFVRDFLDPAAQQQVLRELDLHPWMDDLKRRVQHYGYRYDYKARRVDVSMYLGALPDFAAPVAKKLVDMRLFRELPDQMIVNEYQPGQGITAHIDCEPCFGDTIATVSLGWAYEMDFIHAETGEARPIMLATGSALVMSGEARYRWLHRIKARKSDLGVPRERRVSLTFRNVLLAGSAVACEIVPRSSSFLT